MISRNPTARRQVATMPIPRDETRAARARADGLDLKRLLLRRVTLFALAICLGGIVTVLVQTQAELRRQVARIGPTLLERLINEEAMQPRGSFLMGLEELKLASLDPLGEWLDICVEAEDLFGRQRVRRCFGERLALPAALRGLPALLLDGRELYRGPIVQYPGYRVGEFVITPNLDSLARSAWRQIRTVLGMTAGILLLNLFVYLPVRRALRPSEQILAVMEKMRAGDLSVRMPRPALHELQRIASGFDELADRLQQTLDEQRRLAQRLIAVREEERRHLGRELHDEFGQCLTSIGAEAVFIGGQVRERLPELLPAVGSISEVTAKMLEALQGILSQLRPVGLESFGLQAILEQFLAGWQRRQPDCRFTLDLDGPLDDLPDELTVSLYRIVQESLTNALRHGSPTQVTVQLQRHDRHCRLCIEDDGEAGENPTAGSGLGVLGMRERVLALGGRFSMTPRSPRGMRVLAEFPAESLSAERSFHA